MTFVLLGLTETRAILQPQIAAFQGQVGHSNLCFSGSSQHTVQGKTFQGCSPHPCQEIPRCSPSCHANFFLIAINDSLGRDTLCFPLAVRFYFEITVVLIFASLHPQAHLLPRTFMLAVLKPLLKGFRCENTAVLVTVDPRGHHPLWRQTRGAAFALQKPQHKQAAVPAGDSRPHGHTGSTRSPSFGPILALGRATMTVTDAWLRPGVT